MSERRKSYTPRMAWGWVNHVVIFIFGWTNRLMANFAGTCTSDNKGLLLLLLLLTIPLYISLVNQLYHADHTDPPFYTSILEIHADYIVNKNKLIEHGTINAICLIYGLIGFLHFWNLEKSGNFKCGFTGLEKFIKMIKIFNGVYTNCNIFLCSAKIFH